MAALAKAHFKSHRKSRKFYGVHLCRNSSRSCIERLFGKRIAEKHLASHNRTSLAYYFKESNRVRGICKFENFTLQRAAHPFVPFLYRIPRMDRRLFFFFFRRTNDSTEILPRKREGRVRPSGRR